MLMVCFKDVKLCLHVGLMLQSLAELCVSALIRLIKDKSVRGRQTFFMSPFQTGRNTLSSPLHFSIKHNETACCGKKKRKKSSHHLPSSQ